MITNLAILTRKWQEVDRRDERLVIHPSRRLPIEPDRRQLPADGSQVPDLHNVGLRRRSQLTSVRAETPPGAHRAISRALTGARTAVGQ
jgi:hypothetical protein